MEPLLAIGLVNVLLAALLAVIVIGISRAVRRPALLHCLWLLVLLKLLSPPLVPLPILTPEPSEPKATATANVEPAPALMVEPVVFEVALDPGEAAGPATVTFRQRRLPPVEVKPEPTPAQVAETAAPTPIPWRLIVGGVWLAGTGFCLGWALVGLLRFQRLLRHAERGSAAIQYQARELAGRMGLMWCPEVWLLPGPLPPLVWAAFGRARLYFPRDLLTRLDDEGRASLLAHELAHVCRRDHWVRWPELFAVALYWWCPLVWLARARLRECEEECCDAWVVEQLPPRSYAGAILETIEFLSGTPRVIPSTASGLGRVDTLKRRLIAIMQRRQPRALSTLGRLVVLLLACLLPVLPTRGKSTPPEQKPITLPPAPPVASAVVPEVTFTSRPTELTQTMPVVQYIPVVMSGNGVPTTGYFADVGGVNRSPILALAVSPDGKRVAVATEDQRVVVKDRRSGKVLYTFHDHDDVVTCLAFSPDGRLLVTGSPDTKVLVHDAETGVVRATLAGHTSWVYAAVFAPDGKTLATAGYDRVIRLWDVADGFRERGQLNGHTASVRALAFTSDSTLLASAGSDGGIRIWDVSSGKTRHLLKGHTRTVRGLAFTPNGKTLASVGEDRMVRQWDVIEGRQLCEMPGHGAEVWSVAYSPGGRTLVTGGADSILRFWETSTGRPRGALQGHHDAITGIAFDRDGRTLITAGLDRTVKLWPASTGPSNSDRLVRVWEVVTGKFRPLPRGSENAVFQVDVTRDGRVIVSADEPVKRPEAILFGVRLTADSLILTFGPAPMKDR